MTQTIAPKIKQPQTDQIKKGDTKTTKKARQERQQKQQKRTLRKLKQHQNRDIRTRDNNNKNKGNTALPKTETKKTTDKATVIKKSKKTIKLREPLAKKKQTTTPRIVNTKKQSIKRRTKNYANRQQKLSKQNDDIDEMKKGAEEPTPETNKHQAIDKKKQQNKKGQNTEQHEEITATPGEPTNNVKKNRSTETVNGKEAPITGKGLEKREIRAAIRNHKPKTTNTLNKLSNTGKTSQAATPGAETKTKRIDEPKHRADKTKEKETPNQKDDEAHKKKAMNDEQEKKDPQNKKLKANPGETKPPSGPTTKQKTTTTKKEKPK
ncbi:hypothetical protein [Lysinibacillus fusiformis]|uniref:hypothetical protein n=1 Tax=Lysinibacillus fusiformis TaxID=28031 RepID=UPI0008EC842C|nr:hypothetical protein [Lysinibacillus fusiformis]SFS34915.1 hypothetical protein SAMN02787099_00266 [Lysinibacillus fusiformis]